MWRAKIGAAGLLVANAIGAGIFALPYVADVSGWGAYLFYLVGLSIVLAAVHGYYGKALDRVPGHHRLTGLVHLYLPRRFFGAAVVAILGGLLVALVVYLLLSAVFLRTLFSGAPDAAGVFLMWALGSYPLFVGLRRMVALEFGGTLAMAAIILWVFLGADNMTAAFADPAFAPGKGFFPFAPVLFALAAWTAIGPMRDYERSAGAATRISGWWPIIAGAAVVAALYAAFAFGIIGSAFEVTTDTLSGLLGWPAWSVRLLSLLGLIALWTSYVPIAREARDSLAHDFHWSPSSSSIFVALTPLALLGLGLTSFLGAIQLAGGVFLSAQYIFVILVAQHALRLRPPARWFLSIAALFFFVAALYELWGFVVR